MPTYKLTDPASGKTVRITGDTPPTEQEIEQIFSSVSQAPASAPAEQPKKDDGFDWQKYAMDTVRKSAGDYMQGVKELGKYARPVAEIGGAMIGGTLAAPFNAVVPVGAEAAGIGLGYLGGRRVADAIESFTGQKSMTPAQVVQSTISDIPSAVEQAVAGPITEKVVVGTGKLLAKAAPRLYESTLKIPPSVPAATRNKAVRTGLANEVAVSEKGLEGLQSKIAGLNDEIAQAVDGLAQEQRYASALNTKKGYKEYDENMIDVKSVLSKLDDLKSFYRESAPAPGPYLQAINQYKKDIIAARGKEMFADAAQKLKQGIYRLHNKHYGEMKGIDIEMDKAVARGLKDELVAKFPQLKDLNEQDSALINLQAFLERAVNRTRNYDIVSLGDQIMTTTGAAAGGAPGAAAAGFAKKIFSGPEFKSKLAFALKRAGNVAGAPKTATSMKAIAYGASRNEPIGNKQSFNSTDAEDIANWIASAIGTQEAEAATLSDYARGADNPRARALREAAGDEPTTRTEIPQASTATETVTVAPAKVKHRSDGTWVKWDDYQQGWVKMTPAEIRAQGAI